MRFIFLLLTILFFSNSTFAQVVLDTSKPTLAIWVQIPDSSYNIFEKYLSIKAIPWSEKVTTKSTQMLTYKITAPSEINTLTEFLLHTSLLTKAEFRMTKDTIDATETYTLHLSTGETLGLNARSVISKLLYQNLLPSSIELSKGMIRVKLLHIDSPIQSRLLGVVNATKTTVTTSYPIRIPVKIIRSVQLRIDNTKLSNTEARIELAKIEGIIFVSKSNSIPGSISVTASSTENDADLASRLQMIPFIKENGVTVTPSVPPPNPYETRPADTKNNKTTYDLEKTNIASNLSCHKIFGD